MRERGYTDKALRREAMSAVRAKARAEGWRGVRFDYFILDLVPVAGTTAIEPVLIARARRADGVPFDVRIAL